MLAKRSMIANVGAPRPEALGRDAEFAFSVSDFRWIAEFLLAECGIALGENKMNLVYSRLAKRLRALGLNSFQDYCELVGSEAGDAERKAMIAAMTTNVTRFFREPHHFDHLRDVLLPHFAKTLRSSGRVRIWSAGCSSGEEPFSIAMTILAAIPDAAALDVRILATDIDPNMVAHARSATYHGLSAESIPNELLRAWAVRKKTDGDTVYEMADKVRALVRFNELNLLRSWPMKGRFDAIFCRNVMIYFNEETQFNVCRRFAEMLPPGGILYIGHSERLAEEGLPFDLAGQTTYAKHGGSAR